MRTAPFRVMRAAEGEAKRREPRIVESDRVRGEGDSLRTNRLDPGFGRQTGAFFDRCEPEDRRSPEEPAVDLGRGLVARTHLELVALPEPSLDRIPELVLELSANVEKGRRPRPRVQVFVRAPHGDVRTRRLELDRDGADRVAAVPQGERARLVRGGSDARHVRDRGRSVVDV